MSTGWRVGHSTCDASPVSIGAPASAVKSRPQPVWIDDHRPLPPTRLALGPDSDAPGLLAVGGTVHPARLAEAYRHGIFPWYGEGQLPLWWSPDPRMVLKVADFHLPQSLRKTLRRFVRTPGCEIRVDHDVAAVIGACASAPRDGQHGTWILPEMQRAYLAWHRLGAVHSVETWIDGQLAGGLYGVALGRMFYGESMFAHRTDASKIALCALVALCRQHHIDWIDCQQQTHHLSRFHARPVPREAFEAHLTRAVALPPVPLWTYDPAWWAHVLEDGAPPVRPADTDGQPQ